MVRTRVAAQGIGEEPRSAGEHRHDLGFRSNLLSVRPEKIVDRGHGDSYGASEHYNRREDYFGSSYRDHNGEGYDRHDRGGLLGTLEGY
jgi:hypothetical protein